MRADNKDNKIITGKINQVFFSYAIPVVLGLVAASSAGIIDGMFIGNYIGKNALAAVTLSAPVFPVLFGIAILFSAGGEVFCGKFIGARNYRKASEVFTKVTTIIFIISVLVSILGLAFIHSIANILGAEEDTHSMVVNYLRIILGSAPLITTFSLSFFVRVDGKPGLSSASLVLTAMLNIILDYIFIVRLNWGIEGAAWGTALSYTIMPVLLLPHFLLKRGEIRFIKFTKSLKIIGEVAYNGSSEFLSEVSGGILFFMINITMMKFYGTQGVAAYAIVGYLLLFTSVICYGISDSIKSIVSVNFGAKKLKRINQFLRTAIITAVFLGAVLLVLTQISSTAYVSLFFKENADPTVNSLANEFILSISPMLLILGTNIILTGYFTAIHKPKSSLIISISRTLILPILFIYFFTNLIGGSGIITALIMSEILTLILSILLIITNKKQVEPRK
ncbi:MAG: MATE family efflux transporter, partial [Bacteroidota bacterium]